MNNNLKKLQDLINEFMDPIDVNHEPIMELIDAIDDDMIDTKDKIKQLKEDNSDLKTQLDDCNSNDPQNQEYIVDLGLDTLFYSLEKGNLKVQMQLEHWINQVKKQNCAGVEIF